MLEVIGRRLRAALLATALLCVMAGSSASALAAGSSSSKSKSKSKPSSNAAAATTPSSSAAGNPFALSTPSVATGQLTSTTTTTTASGSGLGSSGAIIIGVVAFGLLGGVGIYIWRDARSHAPSTPGDGGYDGNTRSGSKAPRKSRKLSPAERKRRKRGRAR